MNLKKFLIQLNIPVQCKKYNLSLWQCPHFLFLVMGIIIIITAIISYLIGNRYFTDPQIVALIVLSITAVLFIIAVIITQSFERLAEINQMKSEFVNIVSHQLRTPLSNLKWAIELFTTGKINGFNEKQLGYFKILKENTNRMNQLVSNLLIVSRIETTDFPFKKKETSLESLVKKVIERADPIIKSSNIKMELEIKKRLPKIFIDPSQIQLVIENLLDNAVRYIEKKGKIKIKLEKKGRYCYFEIEDNGVGIPKKNQKYIFQKFFRSENALKRQTQGSGLGLYIAKSITEKLGGKIGFKSQEDVGSTFWIILPIK